MSTSSQNQESLQIVDSILPRESFSEFKADALTILLNQKQAHILISVVKLRYCVVNGIKDFQAIPSPALKLDLNNLCKLQI